MTPQEQFIKQCENTRCGCSHSKEAHTRENEYQGVTFHDGCTLCECEEFIEPSRPYWECQECFYADKLKAMPNVSPTEWYSRRKPHVCPRCKSEAFQPIGW